MSNRPLAAHVDAAGLDWIVPDWPAPANVHALSTTRNFAQGREIDFSTRSPDVARARAELRRFAPREPLWLAQVHGTTIVSADHPCATAPQADGAVAPPRR